METKPQSAVEAHRHSVTTETAVETDTQPFVSVLTPVYNGGKFLRECIESVLNQDYDNWEYVLVNNHSTDDSLQIMQEYAEKDERIKIHNNEEFLPQMQNLNHAFRQISPFSKYCKVIHADDWLMPNCLSRMVEVAENNPSAGIVSSYRMVNKKVDLDGLQYGTSLFPGKEIARKYLMYGSSNFGSPSSLLLRSDLIRNREKVYEESHQASDSAACLDILKESDFAFAHDILTFSRRHEESMSNTECLENYSFIHAKLYSQLEYGPFFLEEKEFRQSLSRKLNLYYILLSRNLMEQRSIEEYRKQRKILEDLGLDFNRGLFINNFVREFFLQFFKRLGISLQRVTRQ